MKTVKDRRLSLGFQVWTIGALGLVVVFGMAGISSAGDSQLRVDLDNIFCSDSPRRVPLFGCQSARSFGVVISNPNDFEVFEGSEVLSESLSIEVFSSNGERIAWWQPDDEGDGGSGIIRRWAPGEEIRVDVLWYFQTGPFVGSFFGTEEEFERPVAPFDGYQVRLAWRDLSGNTLVDYNEWFEHGPPDLWHFEGSCWHADWLEFESINAIAGIPFAVYVPLRCGSTWTWVHERRVEVDLEAKEILVHANQGCGPFASPSCSRFVQRLPALPGGDYTLRFLGANTGRDSWGLHVHDAAEFDDEPSLERPVTQ